MKIVYNSGTNIPFYTGVSVPESISDSRYDNGVIPDGIYYIDTLSHNVYVMTNSTWVLVTDSTVLSSFVPNTAVITESTVNGSINTRTYRANSTFYYTSTFGGYVSVILPQTSSNSGLWFALEDSLGQGFNVCVDSRTGLKVIERVGGITGVSTKHYFFCDGTKWHLAKSFLPSANPYVNYSKEFQDKINSVTIVVDDINGNNSTGVVGANCYKFPFKTVTQANFKATGKDVMLIKPGTYINDNNIIPKSGLTILMMENAIIQPTTQIIPIFTDLWTINNTFTILGKGKLLSWGDMRNDQTALYVNGINTKWDIELAELGTAQLLSGYFTERLNTLIIKNTKILGYVGNYAKASELIIENCVFENAMLQNMYLESINFASEFYQTATTAPTRKYPHPTLVKGKSTTFRNCTFIKTQIIPYMYNFGYVGQREDYYYWSKNDLDIISFVSHQRNPNQGWSDTGDGTNPSNIPPAELSFISCKFINKVGGNGLTLYINPSALSKNRAFVSITDCQFYLTNENNPSQVNPMYNITTYGNDDSTTSSYLFVGNFSNVGNNATAPTVLTNQLPGSGFTINSNFTI